MEHVMPRAILIAEDETEISNLLRMVFEQEKFSVYEAADGPEALEVFTAHQDEIVVLFTDLGLPKLGGIELIQSIRGVKPSVKIIAVSGYGRADVKNEVIKAGGDEFFPKPFLVKDIVETVKRLLGQG
jgi:DNA-binding response OmpR family regulator